MTAVQFSYFGYSTSFETSAPTVAERRAEANARVIAKFGPAPAIPDFVPMLTWDAERGEFN